MTRKQIERMSDEAITAAVQRRIHDAAEAICELWWTNGQENYTAKVNTVAAIMAKHILGDPFMLAEDPEVRPCLGKRLLPRLALK